MSLITVAGGQPIRSTHVTQFTRWIQGATKDQSASFTTTHATEYTATLTNEETSAGNVLKLVSGASTIALFNKTGATLSVPIIGTGVLSGLFSATGQTLYGSGGTGAATLTIGSTFQSLLVSTSGVPFWAPSPTSVLSAQADLLGASAANTLARIPKGTAFQVLQMNAGATGQTWASSLMSLASTAGQLFYATGANTATTLVIGSTGQVLTVSTGALPSWASLPAGQLPASDGTVSAPTINFSSQTSTGLYRPASGTIGFAGASVSAMTLSSATNAGLAMATNVPIVPAAVSGTPIQHGLYSDNVVKGWCYYSSTVASILASFNVTSLTDNGVGLTMITWDRDFASANYAAHGAPGPGGFVLVETARASGTTTFQALNGAAAAVDVICSVVVLGAQ